MIRVVLDARKVGDGGIGRYIENLVDGLLERNTVSLTLLTRPVAAITSPLKRTVTEDALSRWQHAVEIVEEHAPLYSVSELVALPKRHRALFATADVYHAPHYTLPFQLPIPSVVTVHDAIHITNPERRVQRYIGGTLLRSAIRRAEQVITVSDYSRHDLVSLVSGCGVKISVIPNAVRPTFAMLPPDEVVERLSRFERLQKTFCLFVGSDRPHKGLQELLLAWKMLRPHHHAMPQLVLVGDSYSKETFQSIVALGLEDVVDVLGPVHERELVALYNSCRATIIPSRVEGFGLPAAEALACGADVVCSMTPALQEVCRNAAWYAPQVTPRALADTISAMLRSSPRTKGITLPEFLSPTAVAEQTERVYLRATGVTPLRGNGLREKVENAATAPIGRGVVGA